jgi:hypothetical protein
MPNVSEVRVCPDCHTHPEGTPCAAASLPRPSEVTITSGSAEAADLTRLAVILDAMDADRRQRALAWLAGAYGGAG